MNDNHQHVSVVTIANISFLTVSYSWKLKCNNYFKLSIDYLSVWPHAAGVEEISMRNLHITLNIRWSWEESEWWMAVQAKVYMKTCVLDTAGRPGDRVWKQHWAQTEENLLHQRWNTGGGRQWGGGGGAGAATAAIWYTSSQKTVVTVRGILHLTWHSNFPLCLCHLSKGTRSRELPS